MNQSANWKENLRHDLLASVVVFLVALPLCIGIAVAVGVSPARALITGIIGGIVVGFLAGSPLQVSGPAAGLFVIVADILAQNRERYLAHLGETTTAEAANAAAANYALLALGVAVFLAGVLQYVAGKLRLGQWFRAVSPAVIQGMLAGIGILILISQFHVMLDHDPTWNGKPAHGGLQLAATIPAAIMKCCSTTTGHDHHLAAATGILTITIIVLWLKFAPKSIRLLPAALVAIVAAAIFAMLADLPVLKLEVPRNMFSEITLPTTTSLGLLVTPSTLVAAFVIAVVASAETLLCATAVDQMQNGPRTNYDKELSSQGVGNMLCGLLGALPMTGVIVRSSANVNAGARTRNSAIFHGVWLLLFVAMLPGLLNFIPKAALGALLVYTGWKLVNLKAVRDLWSFSRGEVAIYATTVVLIVAVDLLTGVLVGITLSAFKLLYRFSRLDADLETSPDRKRATLHMHGAATFLRLPLLAKKLELVPAGAELHVHFDELDYIDHACLDLLMNWARQHQSSGGSLVVDWEQLHGRFRRDENGNSRMTPSKHADAIAVAEYCINPEGELAGTTLRDLAIVRQGLIVTAIRRADGSLVTAPPEETTLSVGDTLILAGQPELIRRVQQDDRRLEGAELASV